MKLSYSAITTYETCPAKFRFQYEDRVPTAPSPYLSFGSSLHRALYRFHDRPVPVAPSLEDLLGFLDEEWVGEGFADASDEEAYRRHAREVLTAYHRDNAGSFRIPAALEHGFRIEVEGVTLTGQIDRMDRRPGGGYEIIDYKTNRRLPPKTVVERDLQMSIYALAAWEVWGILPERVTLYYLLPGQRMSATRTMDDLDALRQRIATVAQRIAAERFEPRDNPLCNWCDFQRLCPLYRHRHERDAAPRIAEVVEEWIALKREERGRARRLEELGATITAYAEEHALGRLFAGDDAAVQIRERIETAPDAERVRRLLEPLGLWDGVIAVDPTRLQALIESRTLPPDVEDALLAGREEVRTTKALTLREPARSRR